MDLKQIEELIEILKDTDVSELKIEEDDIEIDIKRGFNNNVVTGQPVVNTKVSNESEVKNKKSEKNEKENTDREEIVAPMVGTFYRSPSPEADPFVEIGDTVENGDVVCILEAMKLMNEIEAETKCKIIDVLVEDGEAIEYGQPLFEIEKL
ncbi:MAG TPA: acetyl-CoA carboxylase biotin carboxyl carrier protein [Halanaerobiales bacterium]|nr:acetyl-CoA carboxylase biotin carboxyl carrier protein [Halanaerobiales bacterium]